MEQSKVTERSKERPSNTSKNTSSNTLLVVLLITILIGILGMWITYHSGYVAGVKCAEHAYNSFSGGFC
jgi:hypothetical protein